MLFFIMSVTKKKCICVCIFVGKKIVGGRGGKYKKKELEIRYILKAIIQKKKRKVKEKPKNSNPQKQTHRWVCYST